MDKVQSFCEETKNNNKVASIDINSVKKKDEEFKMVSLDK